MIKSYYGNRGSGKTTKLLKEAAKAVIDEYTVVFVTINEGCNGLLKYQATQLLGSDIANKINFMTYNRVKDFMPGRDKHKLKVFIDESQFILYQMLFKSNVDDVDVSMS